MKFWTRQVPKVMEILENAGVYRVQKEYIIQKNGDIADFYLGLYEWYTKKASKYISIPADCAYPIWLSIEKDQTLPFAEDTIMLELEVPEGHYVISRYDNWEYRGNYMYVPLDKEDEKRHRGEMKKYGIPSDDTLILTDKGNFYPLLRKKIIDSWERVFTMVEEDTNNVGTVWEIRKEWVKEVTVYEQDGNN